MTIEELKRRRAELLETAKAFQAKADAEKRDLTEDEIKALEGTLAEADQIKADVARRERIEALDTELSASAGRRSAPTQATQIVEPDNSLQARDIRTPLRTSGERGRWGWHNFGDFAAAVRGANAPGSATDPRLVNAPTTYGSESVGADGGFAVPPEFRSAILAKVTGDDSLLSRCDQVITGSNGITVPKDETTPWGTAGIQGYWDGEAAQMNQRKPALETSTIKLNKVTCLVPVTDELLEDAPALGSYVQRKAGEVIDFKVTDAIINGTGAGMPLGILNAPSTVQQSKESSQVAATIHGLNLVNMWARMPAAWRSTAVWLTHPDAEPQIMRAGLQVGPAAAGTATGGQLIWMPPGGISGSPYASLFGRPIIPTQACKALGTAGDIIFSALGQYAAVIKGGVRADTSIHLFFDYGLTAFRFVFRMGGQPWWSTPIAAKNGSTTYGPFVTLEGR